MTKTNEIEYTWEQLRADEMAALDKLEKIECALLAEIKAMSSEFGAELETWFSFIRADYCSFYLEKIVDKYKGDDNNDLLEHEDWDGNLFKHLQMKKIYNTQRCVGMEGDSFEGETYILLPNKKYLAISWSM